MFLGCFYLFRQLDLGPFALIVFFIEALGILGRCFIDLEMNPDSFHFRVGIIYQRNLLHAFFNHINIGGNQVAVELVLLIFFGIVHILMQVLEFFVIFFQQCVQLMPQIGAFGLKTDFFILDIVEGLQHF